MVKSAVSELPFAAGLATDTDLTLLPFRLLLRDFSDAGPLRKYSHRSSGKIVHRLVKGDIHSISLRAVVRSRSESTSNLGSMIVPEAFSKPFIQLAQFSYVSSP